MASIVTDRTPTSSSEMSAKAASPKGILDIFGIGFGPSNLSLGILIEELNAGKDKSDRIRAAFCESQAKFGWHTGMLLPGTDMQISFLKDLATPRNPRSAYSFINYVFQQGRLPEFTNLQTFNPSRREFHSYLEWAANRVSTDVHYGTRAIAVSRCENIYKIVTENSDGVKETHFAKNVIIGTGIVPKLPEGVRTSTRVFHNHQLTGNIDKIPSFNRRRFVVVGSGQSAAEVTQYLHARFNQAEVHSVYRRFGYTPSDDTPFANQIFDASAVDEFFYAPPDVKESLLKKHWLTNYSAVDSDLIEDLFRKWYNASIEGDNRLHYHRVSHLSVAEDRGDYVDVEIEQEGGGEHRQLEADAVIFATGFSQGDPRMLFDNSMNLENAFDDRGRPVLSRNYRLKIDPENTSGIYLNGNVEHSHGLTSSLLSNVSVRSQDILFDLIGKDHSVYVGVV